MIESVHRNGRTVSEFAEDIVDRETAFLVFRHPCIGGCEGGSRQRPWDGEGESRWICRVFYG